MGKTVLLVGLLVVIGLGITGCVSASKCAEIRAEGYSLVDRMHSKYFPPINPNNKIGPTLQELVNKYGARPVQYCLYQTEGLAMYGSGFINTLNREKYWEQDKRRYEKTLKNSVNLSSSTIENAIGTIPTWAYCRTFTIGGDIWKLDYSMGHTYTTSSHNYRDRWYKDMYDRYIVFHYVDGKLNSYSRP